MANKNSIKNAFNEDEVTELKLFVDNDSNLYRQRTVPIYKNLEKKMRNKTYDSTKAQKSFKLLADEGSKKYNQEFGTKNDRNIFTVADRNEVATRLKKDFEEESKSQNHNMFN